MSKNTGKIVQVIGPVVDVAFENGELPQLLTAIEIPLKDSESLIVEVAQHIGDERVRCIAMGGTDGLVRGMEAIDTGSASVYRSARKFWEECLMSSDVK